MINMYRRRPENVAAIQYDGSNGQEILDWLDSLDKMTYHRIGEEGSAVLRYDNGEEATVGDFVLYTAFGGAFWLGDHLFAQQYEPAAS